MVVDSSALLALLRAEPESQAFERALLRDPTRLISAATVVEAGTVIEARMGEAAGRELDLFLERTGITIVALDAEQAKLARRAFRRFGKGRHPAGLNFGDCFAYALSQATGEPLLFKGDDFRKTDVKQVL